MRRIFTDPIRGLFLPGFGSHNQIPQPWCFGNGSGAKT